MTRMNLSSLGLTLFVVGSGGICSCGDDASTSTAAADTESSGNHMGVKSPAVDALVAAAAGAKSKAELLPACRALDRVIMHSHYLIPQWTLASHRMAYNAWRLGFKQPVPP